MSLKQQFDLVAVTNALFSAVAANDTSRVRGLVENEYAYIDMPDAEGVTVLMKAIDQKNLPMARLLVELGADVNAADRHGSSVLKHIIDLWGTGADRDLMDPLFRMVLDAGLTQDGLEGVPHDYRKDIASRAITAGKTDTLQMLLDNDVAADASFNDHSNLMTHAAKAGQADSIRLLHSRGADINYGNLMTSETPLRAAMREKHFAAVEALLELGADTGAEAREGMNNKITDLEFSKNTTPEIAAAVAKAAVKFAVNAAAEKGDSAKLEQLLSAGAPVDTVDRTGNTGLTHAVNKNHTSAVKVLLKYKADTKKTGRISLPLLHVSVHAKNFEMSKDLAAAGASTYDLDLGGNTLVQRAEKMDRDTLDFVKKLRWQEIQTFGRQNKDDLPAPAPAVFAKKALKP